MNLHEYIDQIKDKKITVLGIGVSNTPLIQMLLECGCDVTACDGKTREQLGDLAASLEAQGAALKLGPDYLDGLDGDIIFRTPGLRPDLPQIQAAVDRGAVLTSEMEAFFQVCPCKIIAVTGSDGKTTTTSIIAELLKAAGYTVHVGGNIGTPLLCSADKMCSTDMVVLELSSFQLMTMTQSPHIAVVTNLAPNHLDVHRDMDEYIAAKKNIFLHQSGEDLLIINQDNDITAEFSGIARGAVKCFSRLSPVENGMVCENGAIFAVHNGQKEKILDTAEIFLPGVHNIENYMAAFAAVESLVSYDVMSACAKSFKGVEHRIEYVRTVNGVKYFNDSIASSPSRTIAGLRSFSQKVILIAGGKDKGVPFDTLATEVNERAKALILTGYTAEKIRETVLKAENYTDALPIYICDSVQDSVVFANKIAQPGDVVILSPACTSFDKFKNFAERGRVFKDAVNQL